MTVDQAIVPQLQVVRTRVALIDLDGHPSVPGAVYVSDALQTCKVTPTYNAGAEIKEANAAGTTYIDYVAPPSLVKGVLTMAFLTTDPYLMSILQSQGEALAGSFGIGWKYPKIGPQEGQLSLEFWTLRVHDGVVDATYPYAHWAMPYVKNVQIGDRDFAAAAGLSNLTGELYENQNWFDGPANDWPATAEPADAMAQWVTATTLPDVSTGAPDLVVAS
jgi:hypothetical protein